VFELFKIVKTRVRKLCFELFIKQQESKDGSESYALRRDICRGRFEERIEATAGDE